MMFLEWLGIFLISALLITVLVKRSAPFWTIGAVLFVAATLFFVLPTVTSVTTATY
jgi:hypothetical protein